MDPEDGQLRYSISGQYFSVNSQTGVVTLAKRLDREEQDSLEVILSITGVYADFIRYYDIRTHNCTTK